MSGTRVDITHRALAALILLALGATMALVGVLGAASTASADSHGNGNGKGANQSGPFDPHDVGGGDKQGNGNAPANGTVGNADGKNPPGQLKNNKNRGYECAANKGVGNSGGNPAHSGCSTGGESPTTLPTESTAPRPGGGGGGENTPGIDVKGVEATAPADGDPAVATADDAGPGAGVPTAVDAGSGERALVACSTLWILAGAALALVGLVLGLSPGTPRGKRTI